MSAPNQVKVGLRVTITATVTDASILSIVPEGGGVTLTDVLQGKAVALNGGAPVPLSDGKAVLSVIPSVAGKHTITAHYTGVDASFAGSTAQASRCLSPGFRRRDIQLRSSCRRSLQPEAA